MAEELDYRRVLRKCISRLKEDLEPESILDQFTESDYLASTTIRDIREIPTTTKKNEAIVNIVLTKGIKGYKKFKRLLRKSYQAHLAEVLERMEKEVQKDQQSKSGPNLDARGSQHNPVRSTTSTTYNYGGQNSINMFDGNLNVNSDINFGGNRTHPTSDQNNPGMTAKYPEAHLQNYGQSNHGMTARYPEAHLPSYGQSNPGMTARYPEDHLPSYGQSNPGMTEGYPGAYLPKDQNVARRSDCMETMNFGGQNALNVFGGHVNLQGNLHFGGGPPEVSHVVQPGYQVSNNNSNLWNYQNRSREQQGPPEVSHVVQPGYQLSNNNSNLWNYQNRSREQQSQHGNLQNLQNQFSQITIQNHEGSSRHVPQHTEPNNHGYGSHLPIKSGIQWRLQQPQMQPHSEFSSHKSFGQTQAESTSVQHIGKVPVEEDQRKLTVQPDEIQFYDRLQGSNQQDQTKEGEQQRDERGSNDETDAPGLEENTNEGDMETIAKGLPSISRQETIEKPQDVDDGRVIDVSLEWLNSVLQEEPFSSGKSGEVFKSKAIISEWKMEIAVKKIQRTKYNARAAENEVIAARLRHHAIVPLLGRCLEDDQFYYFVFPYMENGNLREAIKQDTDNEGLRMNVKNRVFILYKISCAILYIHTEVQDLRPKMVHGDITTTNIVLDGHDNPRLLDFGVARSLKDKDSVTLRPGDQIGAYTTRVADKRLSLETDYRSFGVVILEMLTGGDDPKQLKNMNLKFLEKAFGHCFKTFLNIDMEIEDDYYTHFNEVKGVYLHKVWEKDEDIYKKLKELAGKCLKGEVDAVQIAEALCNILNNTIGYRWNVPKDEKCSKCMINPAVEEPDFNLHVENCQEASCRMAVPNVCVACMRNSYLNPIQCLACRKTVHTKIGTCWAAILITGYDKTDQSVFQQDTRLMRDTLTSRYPLITGLSSENVYCIEMNELEDTVKKLKDKGFIKSVFIYYSGHFYKDEGKGFQTHEHSFTPKGEFEKHIKALERDIILVTDCCFSGELKDFCPNIRIQIGASGSEETAEFKQSGSMLTKFFIHSLKGKSQGSPCPLTDNFTCNICKNYNPAEDRVGFISVRKMFRNIKKHMEEYYKKGPHKSSRPSLSIRDSDDDCFIGYHIDKKTEIKFGIEDNTESKQSAGEFVISELPKEMEDLQIILFREVLKQKNVDVDKHQGLWEKYSDVISVIVREGPHKEHKTELPTIAKVSDAVIQKFDISCSLRPIQKLNEGKVGMFLTDLTLGKVVECVSKINHDDLKVQRREKESVITIDWEKIKDWSIVEALRESGPAETWLKDTLLHMAMQYDKMEAKELVMTAPFGGCSSVCEMAKNFLVIEIRKEETS